MSSLHNKQIPPPASWEEFEDMCCDLWRLLWNDPNAQKNGRKGQAQAGVDVFGRPDDGSEWAGVQCKGKDNYAEKTLTEKELRDEVDKAKNFTSPITKEYVLATTGLRDAKIQQVAREITQQHKKEGLFPVQVWFWEDIKKKLAEYDGLVKKYYPDLYATTLGNTQIEQILEKLTAQNESQNKILEGVQRIEQNGGIQTEMIVAEALTSEYEEDLNYARDLINEYKPHEALKFLNRLRDRIWSKADSNTRYRLINYIGSAEAHLDNIQTGAKYFIEALQYNSDDEKALLNAALGYIMLNQREEAEPLVCKVLKRNPASSRVYSMLVHINEEEPYETVLNDIPEAHFNDPEVAHALGKLAANKGKLKEAKEWLERGIENDQGDILELKVTLGFILVEMLRDSIESFVVEKIDEDTQSIIERIIELFTEAWEKVKNTDLKFVKHSWIAQRGIMFRFKKECEQATKDLDIAIELCPDNPIYKRFRALLAYESGDIQKTTTLLNELINSSEQPMVVILLADIYRKTGRTDDAIKILTDCIEQHPDHNLIGEVKRSLVYTYLRTDNLDKAEDLVNEIRDEDPKNILHLVAAAEILALRDQRPDALSLLNEAKAYALKRGLMRERSSVARELEKLGQYQEATELYEKIADQTKYTPLTRNLIFCYYKIGKLGHALEICQNILQKADSPPEIIELAAAIQEELGNLPEARSLYERYLSSHPDDESVRLRKARLDFRTQAFDDVDRYLQRDIDTSGLDLTDIFGLAEIYGIRGHKRKTIELLYETLRTHYNDGQVHGKYIIECLECFQNQDDDNVEWSYTTRADVDTAICVEDESEKRTWYVIEDREDVKIDRGEIQPSHKIAQQLLGKSVGEEIILRDSPLSTEKGTIVEIRSKYVHACRESMENIETRFPDIPFHQLTIQGLDSDDQEYVWQQFEPFLRIVRERRAQADMAVDVYRTRCFPIGAFADSLALHPLDAWGALMSQTDPGIRCCQGTIEERNIALDLLENPNVKLVIDLISLMTIHMIGLQDRVVSTFGKLLIAQSTMDEIQECIIARNGIQSQGFSGLTHEHDHYVQAEISKEQIQSQVEDLEEILKWVRENCEVTPIKAVESIDRREREDREKLFGKSFFDTAFIALDPNHVLFSDDLYLRSIDKLDKHEMEYGTNGVWTQVVLEICTKRGHLKKGEYIKAVIQLVTANYHHTVVDVDTVIEAARQSKWQLDYPLDQILRTLSGKYCDEDAAIGVAVNFVYQLWQESFMPYSSDTIIFAVLDVITEERNRRVVLDKFMRDVNSKFFLLPLAIEKIEETVHMWRQSQAHDLTVSV